MKKIFLGFVIALTITVIPISVKAQNNVWVHVKDYEGVTVSWRWRQELKDQFIAELMFENNNDYNVEITFAAGFICHNGYESKEATQLIEVRAGGKKRGQGDGLYYYPCKDVLPPRSGGYKEMTIKRAD